MNRTELLTAIQDAIASGFADAVAALMLPVLVLLNSPDSTDHLSFIGGAPVMAVEIEWPAASVVRNAAPDQHAESYGDEVQTHIEQNLPLGFIAQFDLAGTPISDLPSEGRLLFFYDAITGPYESGTRFAKVIWDTSDAPQLRAIPDALRTAETAYIAATKEALANFEMPVITEETRDILRSSGMTDAEIDEIANAPAPDLDNEPITAPFIGPKKSVTLGQGWVLPAANLHEFETGAPELHQLYFGDTDAGYTFQEAYEELTYETTGLHLLGTPLPEQDDPRLTAAKLALFGQQFFDGDWAREKENIQQEAQNWQLLFEFAMATWLQDGNYEGTVYFLIHKDDLAARRFDKAIGVYQQT